MALSPTETSLIGEHEKDWQATAASDELMLRYYQGRQRVEQLGMAIPPEMRRFLVVANWCRTLVDTINDRQQVRALALLGEETADPHLREIWDASNLSAHTAMFNADRMIYGRAFMSVAGNEDDPRLPLVRVESPREISAFVDKRREVITSAARFYDPDERGVGMRRAVLYLPDSTVWVVRDRGRWVEEDRDEHRLGAVPLVMHLNRRISGSWRGESQMADMVPLVDAAARSLTNLQFAQEAHGIPRMFMTGVSRGEFMDADGKPIPMFEAYFDAIHTLQNADAKVGQLTAADLKNFETALTIYGKQASTVTGFPARYWGLTTANPPAEGAIRADEAPLVRSVEAQNAQAGMTIGWAGALALRVATGEWVTGNRVHTHWFNPATPTVAQREDALSKRRAQGVLSREGYWDELGWSEARKERERRYLAEEMDDPYLTRLASQASRPALTLAEGLAAVDAEPAALD